MAAPAAAAGEVLILVQAAGVDRAAWHAMSGRPDPVPLAGFGVRRPKNPGLGTDIAVVVEAVGASDLGNWPDPSTLTPHVNVEPLDVGTV